MVVALALACACSKPEPQRPQTRVLETPAPVAPPAELVATPAPIAWAQDLTYLPVDADLVFGVDLGRLRGSSLWQTYGRTILSQFEYRLTAIRAECGFDPLEVITAISGASIDTGTTNLHGVVLLHGFSRKLEPCLTKPSFAKLAHGFIDDTTVVLAGTQDEIDRALKGTSGLPTSPAFNDLWSQLTTSGAGWFVANGRAKWLSSLKMLAPGTQALLGSIDLTDRLAIDGRLRLGTSSAATTLVQAIDPQLPAAKALVDRLDVTVEQQDIHVIVAATTAQLQELASQFASPAVKRDRKGR
jgi:hypothetical protein